VHMRCLCGTPLWSDWGALLCCQAWRLVDGVKCAVRCEVAVPVLVGSSMWLWYAIQQVLWRCVCMRRSGRMEGQQPGSDLGPTQHTPLRPCLLASALCNPEVSRHRESDTRGALLALCGTALIPGHRNRTLVWAWPKPWTAQGGQKRAAPPLRHSIIIIFTALAPHKAIPVGFIRSSRSFHGFGLLAAPSFHRAPTGLECSSNTFIIA
jgi:hypothetical protein